MAEEEIRGRVSFVLKIESVSEVEEELGGGGG